MHCKAQDRNSIGFYNVFFQGGMYQRGIEEILNRLVGPTSFLREVRLNEDYISKQVINIIKEVLKPQKPVNQGRVQESIERIIEKVNLKQYYLI